MAKKVVKMCPKEECNAAFIEEFEALMLGKGITVKRGCVGMCKSQTPSCKVDKEKLEASSVQELFDKVAAML